MRLKNNLLALTIFVPLVLAACSGQEGLRITDAKMTTEIIKDTVNQTITPLEVLNVFPEGTQRVSCWFQWADAPNNAEILAQWYFVNPEIHILDSTFLITKNSGSGGIALTMPLGKKLPSGEYRLDLTTQGKILKSLTFKVGQET